MQWRNWGLGGLSLVAMGLTTPALAAPEEVQVYTNDINHPGEVGLELHVNDVLTGDPAPDHPGGQSSTGRVRLTPEWSYGLNEHFELGVYLPLSTLDDRGRFRLDGYKARIKWLPQHVERGWYYGANYEVGREDIHLDQNAWNNELKLIGGWEGDYWLVGGNVDFDFALSGPARTPPQVGLDSKIAYKLQETTLIGLESYNGAGQTNHFGTFGSSDHATYLTLDTKAGRFDVNLGVGRGYGTNADHLIVKLIVGMALGR